MRTWFVRALVPAHRWLLLTATVILAIATTFVAERATEVGNWLALAGAAVLMYMADIFREIDSASRDLARKSERPRRDTVADMFDADAPRLCFALVAVGTGLIVAGLTLHWNATSTAPSNTGRSHRSLGTPLHGRLALPRTQLFAD